MPSQMIDPPNIKRVAGSGLGKAPRAGLPTLRGHALNVGTGFGHKIFAMLSSMLVTALVAREYGLEGLVIVILATQVASYAQLIEFGIPSALSRRLPRAVADGDNAAIRSICTVSLVVLTIGGILILLATPIIALWVPQLFIMTDEQRRSASLLIAVMLVLTAFQLPLRIGFGILSSLHRFSTYFSIEAAALLAKTVIAIALLTLADPPLPIYLAVTVLPLAAAAAVEFRRARRALSAWIIRIGDVSRGVLRELLSLSGAVMIGTLATALMIQGSGIALAFFAPPAVVATYSVPLVLAFSLNGFAASAAAFLAPMASQLADLDDVRLRALVQLSARYAFALAALTWLGALTLGPTVLRVWLGVEALDGDDLATMAWVLVVATGGMALAIPGGTCRGALVAMGRHWQVARVELAAGAGGLALAILATGSGWAQPVVCFAASLFLALVARGVVLLVMASRVLVLSLRNLLFDWARIAFVLAAGGAAMATFDAAWPAGATLADLWRAAVVLGAATVAIWFFVIEDFHRRAILPRLRFDR